VLASLQIKKLHVKNHVHLKINFFQNWVCRFTEVSDWCKSGNKQVLYGPAFLVRVRGGRLCPPRDMRFYSMSSGKYSMHYRSPLTTTLT